jgi:cytochrome c oxidase cbb3-type subunit 3
MRRIAAAGLCIVALSACQRESRNVRPAPASTAVFDTAAFQSDLRPGGSKPATPVANPYQGNAYAISEGQRLYGWYNCTGCHFHGGGGIGPPLIKKDWTYGGEPANIFDTIVKGRPNGMPAWGGRIPEYQIWQIVAFVRSMNNEEPSAATPRRDDTIEPNPAHITNKVPGATK